MPGPAQISSDDFLTACRAYLGAHSRARGGASTAAAAGSAAAGSADDEHGGQALGARLYSRGWSLDESKAHLSPNFAFLRRSLPVQVQLNALEQLQQLNGQHDSHSLDEDWLPDAADHEDLAAAVSSSPIVPRAGPLPDLSSLAVASTSGSGSTTPRAADGPAGHGALQGGSSNSAAPVLATMSQSICYSPTWKVPVFYFSVSRSDGTPFTLDQVIRSSLVQHELDPLLERPGPQHSTDPSDPSSASRTDSSSDLPATFAPISSTEHPITGEPALYLHPCETASWLDTLLRPQLSKREARTALARTSSSSLGSSASSSSSSSSSSDPAIAAATAVDASSTSPADVPMATESSPAAPTAAAVEESRDRTLCSYLETFVALVASAIEMRL
ncbi:hypothetical protein OC835_004867 [Tilletia horrida]|uniref:Ubiquitin-like-conjugating enzyme ATG10 n=1 Tax=Tilletia horrida TaxID=155126 RepID=A0AAN6GEB6_9BASI|nr:hypothetical protein OC835_004867 [Tilletia horrida]KAK0532500.1 hypothetical protein OC842_003282 [Tilletia horrida]KAK0564991.1 hypothetical protein OC844_001445 [Tilletia horrida]